MNAIEEAKNRLNRAIDEGDDVEGVEAEQELFRLLNPLRWAEGDRLAGDN